MAEVAVGARSPLDLGGQLARQREHQHLQRDRWQDAMARGAAMGRGEAGGLAPVPV